MLCMFVLKKSVRIRVTDELDMWKSDSVRILLV
jgi:hypothetical protein